MYRAYSNLVCYHDKVTFLEDDTIHKEELIIKNVNEHRREAVEPIHFENVPTAGYKLNIAWGGFIPIGAQYSQAYIILEHPKLDVKVPITLVAFDRVIKDLTIINGVIQEEILILNSSYSTIIAPRGTALFYTALASLESAYVHQNNIQVGDIVTMDSASTDNTESSKGALFLGSYFASLLERYNNTYSKPRKYYLFYVKHNFGDDTKEHLILLDKVKNPKIIGKKQLANDDFSEMINNNVITEVSEGVLNNGRDKMRYILVAPSKEELGVKIPENYSLSSSSFSSESIKIN